MIDHDPQLMGKVGFLPKNKIILSLNSILILTSFHHQEILSKGFKWEWDKQYLYVNKSKMIFLKRVNFNIKVELINSETSIKKMSVY